MPNYSLSPLFEPQYVAHSAATALQFATPGNPSAVPANVNYLINVLRVANVSAGIVTLEIWRVPNGGTVGNPTLVCPSISIPVATQTLPAMDLTMLWGAVLQPGDAIFMLAGSADALVVQGDGAVIVT
jgi:hypothetical protein